MAGFLIFCIVLIFPIVFQLQKALWQPLVDESIMIQGENNLLSLEEFI